ncbi:hypothetical protein C8A03DRAFT_30350 [Achaetomium macrosporum]|uniref:Uncharacterized protein n=1 Tax=Achaetomium macrosporum TaxID=79813 RepID=A0AAN7HGV2_9PEZI|nr:hypothetical protein C8A03DRAFT_30350 [Achaetomium macrosporum]
MWHNWDPSQNEEQQGETTAAETTEDASVMAEKRPEDYRDIVVTNIHLDGQEPSIFRSICITTEEPYLNFSQFDDSPKAIDGSEVQIILPKPCFSSAKEPLSRSRIRLSRNRDAGRDSGRPGQTLREKES